MEPNYLGKVLFFAVTLLAATCGVAAAQTAVSPFESPAQFAPQGRIDELLSARWKELGIRPAHLCSDAVFVRRAYLDVIGTLPAEEEVRSFLSSQDPDKRRALIDRLLERDEFADYWAMKWSDLLRVKSEFPINLWPNAVQAYHRWIRTCLKQDMPYDRFARELLTSSGSNFRVPQVNFYRAVQSRQPQAIAQAVALTFMGERAEKWPADRQAGMAAFFSRIGYKATSEWKEEIVFFDSRKAPSSAASFPDGTKASLPPDRDPREVFADWLVSPENPWFSRNIVNRVWSWLLGRGIVHEPDDFRPDNPPANGKLLTFLERELVSAHYDLKHVYRLILSSAAYQLAPIPGDGRQGTAEVFAYYPVRRLDAEVLIDALCQVTGSTEEYSSAIPEPYTFMPEGQRAIALADGSITSSFFESFGRPPRDTGLESERSNRPTASQRLFLLNSSHIQTKIGQSAKLQALFQRNETPREIVNGIYLTILSRYPTEEELRTVGAYFQSAGNRRRAAADLVWVLINSAEFLYRH